MTSGGIPPADRRALAASLPSRAVTVVTGSSDAAQHRAPRRHPQPADPALARVISRYTEATVRCCRVRYRVRRTSRTTAST